MHLTAEVRSNLRYNHIESLLSVLALYSKRSRNPIYLRGVDSMLCISLSSMTVIVGVPVGHSVTVGVTDGVKECQKKEKSEETKYS